MISRNTGLSDSPVQTQVKNDLEGSSPVGSKVTSLFRDIRPRSGIQMISTEARTIEDKSGQILTELIFLSADRHSPRSLSKSTFAYLTSKQTARADRL